MPESIILRLAAEELCLLQSVLQINELPGFEANLLSELDDTSRVQALRTAEHTLRARELVGWDEIQRPHVNPVVAEVLLDYAHPRYTLFVDTYLTSRRVMPFFYVVGEQAIYEQCQPEPDVVQLRVLDQEELWKRLYPKLEQNEAPDGEAVQGEIIQSVLNKGIEVAREDTEAASRLFSASLPQPLAEKLAEAYSEPDVVQYIARWEQVPTEEHPAPDAALTIVQGSASSYLLWIEEPNKGQEARVAVRPAIRTLLQSYIMQMLPPSTN